MAYLIIQKIIWIHQNRNDAKGKKMGFQENTSLWTMLKLNVTKLSKVQKKKEIRQTDE